MQKLVSIMSIVVFASIVLAGNALADKEIRKTVNIPVDFSATVQATNCTASPGPQLSIQAEITPSGLDGDFIFKQPGQVSASEQVRVAQAIIPSNNPVTLPSQSVVGSLSDDPYMWLQLTDANGRALSSEIFLGRCSQGSFSPTTVLSLPVATDAVVTTSDCDSVSPLVSVVDGTAELSPINGKVIFRNGSDPMVDPAHSSETSIDLVLLPSGQVYTYPQQAVVAQISANPLISMQFREGAGQALGSEITLGRCLAISK